MAIIIKSGITKNLDDLVTEKLSKINSTALQKKFKTLHHEKKNIEKLNLTGRSKFHCFVN